MTAVVIIGGGIIGVSCAYYAARAGLSVTVLERGAVGGGTTSRGEGNCLISDKAPGPELELARLSRTLWLEISADLGADRLELQRKGGLVVATTDHGLTRLREFGSTQRTAGVSVAEVAPGGLADLEPHLARGLPGGLFYPEDMQVQPMLATRSLLAAAKADGVQVQEKVQVTGAERDPTGRITAVLAGDRRFRADAVVNAAGTWGGEMAARLGGPVPILPRRGFVLVTEPLPQVVRHKVYTADYVSNVASAGAGLEAAAVIEGTQGGTVLIGASRERVGFDNALSVDVVRRLATEAVRLFPFLADVALMNVYHGFRPYCPDHLPVIGPDHRVEGLFHAGGHEGAGIGLAPATGLLTAQLVAGSPATIDASPFSSRRFGQVTV